MFHLAKIHGVAAVGMSVVVAALTLALGAGGPAPDAATLGKESTPLAHSNQPECRASTQTRDAKAIEAEIQALRQSCELELEAFAACRASRPEWNSVELFSCGFEMSTSLAKGDVEDPASLEDCGTSAPPAVASAEGRALRPGNIECPVPACEADLEALEALRRERLETGRLETGRTC